MELGNDTIRIVLSHSAPNGEISKIHQPQRSVSSRLLKRTAPCSLTKHLSNHAVKMTRSNTAASRR